MAEFRKTPYRVLIVDDEPDERDLLADLLRGPNRCVEVRDTPRAALEFLQQNPVDLAFLDQRMPGMSGTELAEKIKTLYPRTHIVICTGYLVEAGCPEVRDRAEHVLHKPLNLGEVLDLADSYSAQ
jgi:two-component system response regulator AtoC